MRMKFKAKKTGNKEEVAVVNSCDCGCTPQARVVRGAAEPGHEHCCCGKVHFAGANAERRPTEYLADRRRAGQDEGITYQTGRESVKAPWGETVPIAFALPVVAETARS